MIQMIKNPRNCWYYCIQTDTLREPSKSFEVLNYKIQHPEKTYKQISDALGIDYDKIRVWVTKYFYRDRINAYNREMVESLQTGIIRFKQNQILEELENQEHHKIILKDERFHLLQKKQIRKSLEEDGKPVPEYLDAQISEKEKQYWINRKRRLEGDKLVDGIPTAPVPLDDISDELIEEKTEIKMFMEAMKGNRDAHNEE